MYIYIFFFFLGGGGGFKRGFGLSWLRIMCDTPLNYHVGLISLMFWRDLRYTVTSWPNRHLTDIKDKGYKRITASRQCETELQKEVE